MQREWGMAVMPSTQLFTWGNVVFEHQAAFWSMHFAPAAASEFSQEDHSHSLGKGLILGLCSMC